MGPNVPTQLAQNETPVAQPNLQQSIGEIPSPKSKWKLILLIIILLVIVGNGAYFLGVEQNKFSEQNSQKTTGTQTIQVPTQVLTQIPSSQPTIDPEKILASLQKTLGVNAPTKAETNDYWLDQNKERISLRGSAFSLGTQANNYVGKYGNFVAFDVDSITEDSLKPLKLSVDSFFTDNFFQVDSNNTFREALDYFYLNMGYSKGDLKCLVVISKTDPFSNFFCGVVDQTKTAWRKELSPIINPTNDQSIIVSVSNLLGNYAKGGAGTMNKGGYSWYAVKINGQWKKVWSGQNEISCTSVNQYSIPKEIYDNECSTNY